MKVIGEEGRAGEGLEEGDEQFYDKTLALADEQM